MTVLIITVLASLATALLALEATLRIEPQTTPLPLEGWTP